MQGVSYAQVLEEIWENERFTVFVGWHAPYAGELARFSDRSGGVSLGHGPELPTVQLPAGWEWEAASEWKVDCSCGEVDADGWCYGKSFGSVLLSIEKNCTCASPATTDVTRRRRWIRQRICVAADAQLELQARVQHVAVERAYLQQLLRDRSAYVTELETYEQERLQCFKTHYTNALAKAKELESVLRQQIQSLDRLQAFLAERSSLELEHAKKMKRFVEKYAVQGSSSSSSNTDATAAAAAAAAADGQTAPARPAPLPTTIEDPDQFIAAASRAYLQMTAMMNDFAILVAEPLAGDIKQHTSGVQELLRQFGTQLSDLRTRLAEVEEAVKAARVALDTTFRAICTEVSHSIDRLTHELLHDGAVASQSEATNNASSAVPVKDFWLAEHAYRSLVQEAENRLRDLVLFTHRQEKSVQSSLGTLRALSYSTSKVFVHEQTQLWQETSAVLAGKDDIGRDPLEGDASAGFPKPSFQPPRERANSRPRNSSVESTGSVDSASARDEVDLQLRPFPVTTCLMKQALLRYADGAALSQATSAEVVEGVVEWRSAIVVWTLDRYFHVFDTDANTLHGVLPLKPTRSFAMKECEARSHPVLSDAFELLYPPSKLKSIFSFASSGSSSGGNGGKESLVFLTLDPQERREWLHLLDSSVEVESEDESQTVARALRLIAEAEDEEDDDDDEGEPEEGTKHKTASQTAPLEKRYPSTGLHPEEGVAL